MTKKNLGKLIDEYGTLKAQKEKIESRMKEIADGIPAEGVQGLKDLIAVGETVTTDSFKASVSESAKRIVDTKQVFQKLGQEKFWKLDPSVSVTKLEKVMGKEEVDELTREFAVSTVLRVVEAKGGK